MTVNGSGFVPGATVTLVGNGLTERTATDRIGRYLMTGLAPGHYAITVAARGFTTFADRDVVVERGERSEADAPLAIPEASQEITVSASTLSH